MENKAFTILVSAATVVASYFVAKIVSRNEYEKTTSDFVRIIANRAVDECIQNEIKSGINERINETVLNKEVEKTISEVKETAEKELSDVRNRYVNYGSEIKQTIKDVITDNIQTSIGDAILGGIARTVTRPI